MGYIYPNKPPQIPEDVQSQLEMLSFDVNEDMELIASWNAESENPFLYYINADYELILEV